MAEIRPGDEPWSVWHMAASSQLISAAEGYAEDAGAALDRAEDFANRALRVGTKRTNMVTTRLLQAVEDVRADLRQ